MHRSVQDRKARIFATLVLVLSLALAWSVCLPVAMAAGSPGDKAASEAVEAENSSVTNPDLSTSPDQENPDPDVSATPGSEDLEHAGPSVSPESDETSGGGGGF